MGRLGESAVVAYCESKGWRILARNWRVLQGELDIIVQDADCVAAVEVKTRRGMAYGSPFEAITPLKMQRLRKLLGIWASIHSFSVTRLRVDAASVLVNHDDTLKIDYLQGVFND
ncbi:YraN family protein [Canibacter sp. lx-72]|uniref:YraN family protein n=1 Tax=Canibacter zhuwentaonis TaxID=2837491 RepID=UPI001BDC727F|nr:YraN family protein [Canibacter zhuwentaonis]MBT1017673.1 YraN family protein [Canibacter zhuwentaonis]MBT1034827.1 YraN family protein [Canibacter zhuwentaonis]